MSISRMRVCKILVPNHIIVLPVLCMIWGRRDSEYTVVGRLVPGPSNALVDDVTYTQCASECRLRIAIACGYACRQFNNNVTWWNTELEM